MIVGNILLIVELYFLNASESIMMPSLTSTSTVNNNTRHEVCPITVPLTSASDIKSWTARSPTASTPHSHALNRPHEDQPSPVWPPPVRSPLPAASSSNPSRTPARADAPYESSVHRVFSPCRLRTRMSALVWLRSPICFVAPSAYPRDIHASSELTDSLTLDATPAW